MLDFFLYVWISNVNLKLDTWVSQYVFKILFAYQITFL